MGLRKCGLKNLFVIIHLLMSRSVSVSQTQALIHFGLAAIVKSFRVRSLITDTATSFIAGMVSPGRSHWVSWRLLNAGQALTGVIAWDFEHSWMDGWMDDDSLVFQACRSSLGSGLCVSPVLGRSDGDSQRSSRISLPVSMKHPSLPTPSCPVLLLLRVIVDGIWR